MKKREEGDEMEKSKQSWYRTRQRLSALILAAVMTLSNTGMISGTALGAESSRDITFSVTGAELVRSVQEAVTEEQEVRAEDIEFTNGKKERFEKLFFSEGKLYEAYPQFQEDGGLDAQLRVFVRMDSELEGDEKQVDGDEELIFLYVNHTDETIRCRTEITRTELDGQEHVKKLGAVTIKSYGNVFGKEGDLGTVDSATPSDARKEIDTATPADAEWQKDTTEVQRRTERKLSTPSQAEQDQEGKTETVKAGGSDLAGLNWCSTAKVKVTSLNELKAFEDVDGFRVEYIVEPEEELAKIKGPVIVPRGDSLRFQVNPSDGYGITAVTVNGEEIYSDMEDELASPSNAEPRLVKTLYELEELDQDAQVVVHLEEALDSFCKAEIVGGNVYETIQQAIDESADGDTIRILADTNGESVRIEEKALTIDLDGHIWTGMEKDSEQKDSQKAGSVITAEDSTLTIVGSGTIQASEGYRSITLKETDLTIGQEDEEGPEILGGSSEGLGIVYESDSLRGGVILACGGKVTLNSGRIADGYVEGEPQEATPSDAGQACGGGIAVIEGGFQMNGGTIENNAADYGYGGGLYVSSSEDLIIKKGEISQNKAADGLGGGLYFEGLGEEPADVRLKEVAVKENQARFGGAAVISGSCQVFSITEDTRTYENQALGDTEIPGLEARVSDEFLIRAQDVKLSDEFEADEASADGDVTLHRIEGEEGFYTLAYGGSSDFDGEAKGYYNRKSEDGIQRYILDDTLYYEDENISVSIQIEGTATVSDEEETYKATPSVAGSAKAKRGLVLEAVPMEHEQPEYEAAKAYAQETGGEEGVVSLSALELEFYHESQPLDVSDCTITAQITPKEPVLAAARQAAAVTVQDAPAAAGGIELTALQGSGDELDELGTLMIGTDTKETPRLDVQVNSANRMLMVSAREASNPHFTVQYYANLEVAKRDAGGYLTIINTDNGGNNQGGNLPENGTDPSTVKLYLEDVGNDKRKIQTEQQLLELYSANEYNYFDAPGLPYVNVFRGNGNYKAQEVWVLKEGRDKTSTNRDDWEIYEPINDPTELDLTNDPNNPEISQKKAILVKDDTVIRLVADTTTSEYNNDVTFYDYDITDNGKTTWDSIGGSHGINSSSNYAGSSDADAKFAFGNANTGTSLENVSWNGNTLNQYNRSGNGFLGCTFGLVTGLDSSGVIQYADGVAAPKLFNDGDANGKRSRNDFKLGFNRNGDTYTLSSVNGPNLGGLEYFNNPVTGTTVYDHIWTNNFWPMDSWPGKDGLTGNYLNRGEYEGFDGTKLYPPSDDGLPHNNLFGMQYSVKFKLTEDYVGPLEYYFFGDDDMWVFLDGRLVCDIGGVHSSVGAYVNLWDYIAKGDAGEHTLSFYYTERGLSGSTCYMQFTLPSVSSRVPVYYNSGLRIEKEVDGPANSDQEFSFDIALKNADGTTPTADYAIVRYNASNERVESTLLHQGEGAFKLKANEYVVIDYLPHGATYTITETGVDGWTVSNRVDSTDTDYDETAEGSIINNEKFHTVIYTNTFRPKLPDTGGSGIFLYAFGGMGLMALPPVYKLGRRKERKTNH
mgnify:FL=1